MLSFIKRLFGKGKGNPQPREFTDEDRKLSAEIRQQRAELQRLKLQHEMETLKLRNEAEKLRLEDEIAEMQGDEEEEPDLFDMMMMMQEKMQQQQQPPQQTTQQKINVSNADLEKFWENLNPIAKAMAKKMDDSTLKATIQQQAPQLDEESVNNAMLLVRGR